MTEDQEIDKLNTTEEDDVEGHKHHRGFSPYGEQAQDDQLDSDDDVEGHKHHRG